MLRRFGIRRATALCIPPPVNEPVKTFLPNSEESRKLDEALQRLRSLSNPHEIPCIVGGTEIFTGNIQTRTVPHDHARVACTYHYADDKTIQLAINSSLQASEKWAKLPFEDRAAIVLRVAHLAATTYRYDLLAATMVGQSKNVLQAEIDAAVETVDFLRFNTYFAQEMFKIQPLSFTSHGEWNRVDYRPLEGFTYAITPFNFTAIAANLSTTPALMGNTVVWKPSDSAMLSNYIYMKILMEAGMPPGVVNFVPMARESAHAVSDHPALAGIAFTGSTAVFRSIWQQVSTNLGTYNNFPTLVGECGGKNFHLLHPTADVEVAVAGTLRSAFEYGGQKCSACSRVYLPASLERAFIDGLVHGAKALKMGDPEQRETFLGAVIDEAAFKRCARYIELARSDSSCEILLGGTCDSSRGWFVPPTIIKTTAADHTLLQEEIFGPVLTLYVYKDSEWEKAVQLAKTNRYALTGSIYCNDRYVTEQVVQGPLRHAGGNLYINDKSTGSVVAQQPFGGSRASGTNDKAGFASFVHRWISSRTIKENFKKSKDVLYPYQE